MIKRKHRYNVFLWEQPHKYTLRADNKEQAERFAVENHNGGRFEDISKTKIIKLVKVK